MSAVKEGSPKVGEKRAAGYRVLQHHDLTGQALADKVTKDEKVKMTKAEGYNCRSLYARDGYPGCTWKPAKKADKPIRRQRRHAEPGVNGSATSTPVFSGLVTGISRELNVQIQQATAPAILQAIGALKPRQMRAYALAVTKEILNGGRTS